jgi:hypothetical protein
MFILVLEHTADNGTYTRQMSRVADRKACNAVCEEFQVDHTGSVKFGLYTDTPGRWEQLSRVEQETPQPEIWGGDPEHPHTWTWTEDDGNGHMGYVCACTAFRL